MNGNTLFVHLPTFVADLDISESSTFVASYIRSIAPVQSRLSEPRGKAAAESASQAKMRDQVSFMDTFISGAILRGANADSALREIFVHQTIRTWSRYPIACLTTEWLVDRHRETEPGQIFVLGSEISDGSARLHLPLLDFSLQASPDHDQWILGTLRLLGIPGMLVNSGKSYHFYGSRLQTDSEWREFLGKALLFGGIVDRRWAAHQLIEGRSALRIGGGSSDQMTVVTYLE